MSIALKPQKVWPTSDGKSFNDRKDAVEHERSLIQIKQLTAATLNTTGFAFTGANVSEDTLVLTVAELPSFIAKNAAAILAALTVKEARAPRAPKVTVAA